MFITKKTSNKKETIQFFFLSFFPVFFCIITSFRFYRFFLLDLTLQAAIKKMERRPFAARIDDQRVQGGP